MGERFSEYRDVANAEFARRRTYEKTSAGYAASGDRGIIKEAREYVRKHKGSKDMVTQGRVEGYQDFLRHVA